MTTPTATPPENVTVDKGKVVAILASITALIASLLALFNVTGDGGNTAPQPSPSAIVSEQPTSSPTATAVAGGCAPKPSSCGFPDASNTGVPAGTKLVAHPGSQTITKDGTVIDGWDTGSIEVKADNVTIRNSRITVTGLFGIHIGSGQGGNLTVQNVTIVGSPGVDCNIGIDAGSQNISGADISGCEDGVHLHGNNVLADTYIHGLLKTSTSHNDGVQVISDYGAVIKHCTIAVATDNNSAIFVQPTKSSTGLTIDNNLLNGGGYTLYIEAAANVVASNNRIGPLHNFGRISTAHGGTPKLVNNVADETGAPL